jgi:hypothetical protein
VLECKVLRDEDGAPFSLLELVIHEAAALLGDYPDLNGFFASGRGWRYRDIAIGFAVNAGRGLKVPVVQASHLHSRLSVARAVRELSLCYFRNELKMDDVIGGTFTVTDLSSYGVTHFIPVLNDRQAAILGICAERPGTGHQDLVLSFDHRISDGMRAAAFLGELRDHFCRRRTYKESGRATGTQTCCSITDIHRLPVRRVLPVLGDRTAAAAERAAARRKLHLLRCVELEILLLLMASTLVDFGVGRLVAATQDVKRRRHC